MFSAVAPPAAPLIEIDLREAHWPGEGICLCWDGDAPAGAVVDGVPQSPLVAAAPVSNMPTVSAVICTRDRPQPLAAALTALARQRWPADEILVVDNGAGGAAAVAASVGARWVVEPRRGVRFARNRGLAEARGEVVAFIDDDCLPASRWIGAVRHAFAAYPKAAGCTGPVIAAELATDAQRWMEARGGFCKGFQRRVFGPDSHRDRWRHYPVQAWIFGTGANMAFRRDALLAAGGFAEDLPRGEDLDVLFRILRDGHRLIYEPCAAVVHDHLRSDAQLRDRLFGWGYGYTAYLTKVAWREPAYRRRALGEIAGFVRYQVRDRWWPAVRGRGDLPRPLVTAELLGALAGIPGYWRDRFRAGRGRS